MKTQTIGNQTVSIKFHYGIKGFQGLKKTQTACNVIIDSPDGQIITPMAVVSRHFRDNFCKEKARKESLRRALEASTMNKSMREIVWRAYFLRIPAKSTAVVE